MLQHTHNLQLGEYNYAKSLWTLEYIHVRPSLQLFSAFLRLSLL